MKTFLLRFRRCVECVLLPAGILWSAGVAIWIWEFPVWKVALWCAVLVSLLVMGIFGLRSRVSLWIVVIAVAVSFLLMTPERQFAAEAWSVECKKIAQVEHSGDGKIRISNIRDFKYQDVERFDVRYTEMICDVDMLESMDIVFSYWDDMVMVAHMLLCFNFRDGKRLAVSLEPRVPAGKRGGDCFLGIYRRYGKMILLGTPEDLLDLRTHYRGETLYSYRTVAEGENLKRIFLSVIRMAQALEKKAEFYNSLTDNCTTGLHHALKAGAALDGGDIRMIFNGFYDKYLFEQGFLARRPGESFGALKVRSYVPGISRGVYRCPIKIKPAAASRGQSPVKFENYGISVNRF